MKRPLKELTSHHSIDKGKTYDSWDNKPSSDAEQQPPDQPEVRQSQQSGQAAAEKAQISSSSHEPK